MEKEFKVKVKMPPDVSVAHMRAYIEKAVCFLRGGYPPEDPMFDLDTNSVKVTRIYKGRIIRVKT